jgi:predicted alpha/beta superfamily hydrolase
MVDRRTVMAAAVFGVGVLVWASGIVAPVRGERRGRQEAQALPVPEKITIHSSVLGEDRTLLVWLPEGYEQSSRRYPVLYVLDGEYFFPVAVSAVQFLSELGYEAGQHPIPEMIVVGVVNVDRDRDYTPTHAPTQSRGRLSFPTSGGAGAFAEFLENEVLPLVDRRYRTHPHRVLSGWSLGGLFTVNTYLERSQLFARYLAISPSLWWDDSIVVKRTRRRLGDGGELSPRRLVITLGALEGGDMDGAVRRGFAPLLSGQPKAAVDFTFVEIPGENHSHVPYKAYFDGLSSLYADWVVPSDALQEGLPAAERFFAGLSRRWGYQVEVPLAVYRILSATLPDLAPALQAARLGVEHYPHSSLAFLSLGRLQQMAGDTTGAVASFRRALDLELQRPIPQSERLRAIRGRLRSVRAP